MNKSNFLFLLVLIIINCNFVVKSKPTAKCQFDRSKSMLILNYQGDSSIICQGNGVTYCYNEDMTCSTSDPYSTIKCSTKNDLKCVGSKIDCIIDDRFECSVDFPNNMTTGSPVVTTSTTSSTTSSYTTSSTTSYNPTTTSSYPITTGTTTYTSGYPYTSTSSTPFPSGSSEAPSRCAGIPECGGFTKGVCMSNGICRCNYSFTGMDCSSQIIVVEPTVNTTEPTVNTNGTKVPEDLNASSLSPKLKFNLFVSLLITVIISMLL
ncbi:hypothetical protein ACTFIZ_002883 [Dictyostelium cf. discoideum]